MGFKEAASTVRAAAYEADRRAYVERGRTERKHRRVGVRPAPDTMAVLTGYLPVEQGIACYAALQRSADTAVATGDSRTRDQIMADTLVERLTGQAAAGDLNIELQLMMPLDALIKPDDQSAAVTRESNRRGPLVGGDPTRRYYDGWLAKLIRLRDQNCRDPFCDAAQDHHHHTHRPSLPQPRTRPTMTLRRAESDR